MCSQRGPVIDEGRSPGAFEEGTEGLGGVGDFSCVILLGGGGGEIFIFLVEGDGHAVFLLFWFVCVCVYVSVCLCLMRADSLMHPKRGI